MLKQLITFLVHFKVNAGKDWCSGSDDLSYYKVITSVTEQRKRDRMAVSVENNVILVVISIMSVSEVFHQ